MAPRACLCADGAPRPLLCRWGPLGYVFSYFFAEPVELCKCFCETHCESSWRFIWDHCRACGQCWPDPPTPSALVPTAFHLQAVALHFFQSSKHWCRGGLSLHCGHAMAIPSCAPAEQLFSVFFQCSFYLSYFLEVSGALRLGAGFCFATVSQTIL